MADNGSALSAAGLFSSRDASWQVLGLTLSKFDPATGERLWWGEVDLLGEGPEKGLLDIGNVRVLEKAGRWICVGQLVDFGDTWGVR